MSFDDVEANRAFADKHCFTFRLLSDLDKTMCVTYGAAGTQPLEYARRVSYLVGPDGAVLEAYDNVAPATHASEVLADIAKHASA